MIVLTTKHAVYCNTDLALTNNETRHICLSLTCKEQDLRLKVNVYLNERISNVIFIKAIFIKYINISITLQICHFLPERLVWRNVQIIFIFVKSILLITCKISTTTVTSGKSCCLSHLLALAWSDIGVHISVQSCTSLSTNRCFDIRDLVNFNAFHHQFAVKYLLHMLNWLAH